MSNLFREMAYGRVQTWMLEEYRLCGAKAGFSPFSDAYNRMQRKDILLYSLAFLLIAAILYHSDYWKAGGVLMLCIMVCIAIFIAVGIGDGHTFLKVNGDDKVFLEWAEKLATIVEHSHLITKDKCREVLIRDLEETAFFITKMENGFGQDSSSIILRQEFEKVYVIGEMFGLVKSRKTYFDRAEARLARNMSEHEDHDPANNPKPLQ